MTTDLHAEAARAACWRKVAEAARAPATARGDLPPAVPRGLHLPRRPRPRPLPHDLGITHCYASPYLAGPARQHARLRHHRPPAAQPRDRHATTTTTPGSPPCTNTAWARSSTSCPTTWASSATRTPGGTTCWRTAPRRPTPATSTSPGTRRRGRSCSDRVLLPVLGDPYGKVLEAQQLRLAYAAGAFTIHYFDHRFPVAPRTLRR